MDERTCLACGDPLTGTARRKYCDNNDRCKRRYQRGQRAPGASASLVTLPTSTKSPDGLAESVEQELRDVGRLETSLGRAAVDLARRLDANHQAPLQQAASAHRELRAAIAEAVKGANAPQSALQARRDELAARRARKAQ